MISVEGRAIANMLSVILRKDIQNLGKMISWVIFYQNTDTFLFKKLSLTSNVLLYLSLKNPIKLE